MEEKNTPPLGEKPPEAGRAARSARIIRSLFSSDERPETLRGLKGAWLVMSCFGALCVLLALLFALFWGVIGACVFAALAAAIFLAVRSVIRDKKKGGCAGCSGGCSCGGACGGHATHNDRCP